MKRLNTSVMTVAVVLALIAFVAPSSAYSISNGNVVCNQDETTTWTFMVTCEPEKVDPIYDISCFTVAWCNGKDSVLSVKVNGSYPIWDYKTWYVGEVYEIKGIKIDSAVLKGETAEVEITLDGCYGLPESVKWVIKADGLHPTGNVDGPVASNCCTEIPEFSTIAIPIASILGLLFFFNRRKRRKEE